jgi:molybdenum cofactor cytidylyltransferase
MELIPPAAIVPAAGASRRMGRPKLLLPYGGGTVLGSLIGALAAAGTAPIVVVTAAGDGALRAWCDRYGRREALEAARGECATPVARGTPRRDGGRVRAATNPAPERGMLSSILVGLAALGGPGDVARRGAPLLVTPGDLPALRGQTVAELLRRAQAAAAPLAIPIYRGRRGHPLLIAAELAAEIESLDPARGLRHLLDLHPGELLIVEVDDPGCAADVDTPEDYASLAR